MTAGPGVTNAVTALKNAQLAQSPVIVLGGAAPTLLQGRGALQDIDQRPLAAPNVKLFKRSAPRARHRGGAGRSLRRGARRRARAGLRGMPGRSPLSRGARAAVVCGGGAEGQSRIAETALRFYINRHLERLFGGSSGRASARAAESPGAARSRSSSDRGGGGGARESASRPVAVIGSQALASGTDPAFVAAAVKRLGVPVYLSGMARGLLGRDHPLQLRHQRRKAMNDADCVILAGVPCDFRLDYGRQIRRSATLIAANRSAQGRAAEPQAQHRRYRRRGLFPRSARRVARARPRASAGAIGSAICGARDAAREADIDRQAAVEGEFVNPIALFRAIDRAAEDNAIFVADGGDFVATASYILRPRGPLSWLDPGPFGTLGVGAGFALGAALARPQLGNLDHLRRRRLRLQPR